LAKLIFFFTAEIEIAPELLEEKVKQFLSEYSFARSEPVGK